MNETTKETNREHAGSRRRARTFVLLGTMLVAVLLSTAVAPASARDGVERARADVAGQGGDGILREDGAKLTRRSKSIKLNWAVPTPDPGGYDYPTADMVPPISPTHPEVAPGYPEVFTLWAFVFNHPELCNGPCDSDDLGDTPAQGGAFLADATIAVDDTIEMVGKIRTRDVPFAGVRLQEPFTAEVHVAMAPHGRAACGDDLLNQLSGPIGNPSLWWVALFL